jgi:hypothetical protein
LPRVLTHHELPLALHAALYISGYGGSMAESIPLALEWSRLVWGQGLDTAPLSLIHDLGLLLLHGRSFPFASRRELDEWPHDERGFRLMFEDQVLARWVLDPTLLDAHVAIAANSEAARQGALAHAIGLALTSIDSPELVAHNPAHLRSHDSYLQELARNWEDTRAIGLESAPEPGWLDWALEQRHTALERLRDHRLFNDADLWELEHYGELASESMRLALREIHRAVALVGVISPKAHAIVRRRAQEIPLSRTTSDQFPAGGLDALSTQGRFENLVRSEVGYVAEVVGNGLDLFDIRFAQGELLFYTRDESPLYDRHHHVTIVFDQAANLRHKCPELAAQTIVLAEAMALRLLSDLGQILGAAGCQATLAWHSVTEDDRAAAEEELKLLTCSLAVEIAHRRVTLQHLDDLGQLDPRGLIVFSTRMPDKRCSAQIWIRVGQPTWWMQDSPFDACEGPQLRSILDEILRLLFVV